MNILVEHLSHTFPGKPPRQALAEVSFRVPSGQFCAVLGPSGCGKTTLLRLAAGLLQPGVGKICLDDQPPEQAAARRRIAWLAQSPALFPWLTARANVELVSRFAHPGDHSQLSPQEALARVGLADAEQVYPFQLSGGMQQRLSLARVLCQGADVWLMDEPFAALDALTRERLAAELLALWQPLSRFAAPAGGQRPEGTPQRPTVLWVTHHIHEAMRLADRALVLSSRPGRVVLDLVIDLPRPRLEDSPGFQSGLRELKTALGLAVPAEAA
jgi:NitT/TauT family transport system ATP-binding protein